MQEVFVTSLLTQPNNKKESVMAIESAKKFIELVQNDSDLAKELSELESGEERLALAKARGFEFTIEEISKVRSELSENVLDQMSGGRGTWICKNFI